MVYKKDTFKDAIILITGGTGSFGNKVLNRFLNFDVKEIRIFSRDEKKQDDMRSSLKDSRITFHLGDVRDKDSILKSMSGVDFVFHAAALKQVPSCEFYPMQAIQTNIIGTSNTIEAAISCGVKKLVVLSTDKAVYPINTMGLSKALAEKIMISSSRFLSGNDTILCATRYGNVMGSRGSVIPLFINQIKKKLDVTITDPEMTRFLMSLEESVDLVLFAFNHAKQGDIFVQKAPAATVQTLHQAISRLFGNKSEPRIIGARHGEKLFESLVSKEEMMVADDLGRFYRLPADARDLNYELYFSEGMKKNPTSYTEYTSHNTERLNVEQTIELLKTQDFVLEELS